MDKKTIKQGLDNIALIDIDVARALPSYGYPEPRIRPAGIETFFSIVVGQQLSTHAAAAIMSKARVLIPQFTAEHIIAKTDEELRSVDDVVRLTSTEATLMRALAAKHGEVLSRDELARACGLEAGERTIDVQVTRLRRKIEEDTKNPRYLQTLRGKGYRLRAEVI